jgi:hypothetical protein
MRTNILTALVMCLATPVLAADWATDLDASLARAAKEKKPLVVEVYADW